MLYTGIRFACYFIMSSKICNAIDFSPSFIEISSLQNPIGKVLSVSPPPYESLLMDYRALLKKVVDICLKDLLTFSPELHQASDTNFPCFFGHRSLLCIRQLYASRESFQKFMP